MSRASDIENEAAQIATVQDLTSVFESLASTQVAKVKNKVELSKEFFRLLWKRYSSIRIDPASRITNRDRTLKNNKKVFIIITAEAGLSGDIDQRLIDVMSVDYDPKTTDIIVLGSHGANLLSQRGLPYVHFFQVPETDDYIDVDPVIDVSTDYSSIVVYYQEYVSLSIQEVRSIDLITNIQTLSQEIDDEVMTDSDTIFEPSLDIIAEEMEVTMMSLALSQSILESNLAQAASRFNAMAVAKKRAGEMIDEYMLEFHRAKRAESDRRLREVLISIKKKKRMKEGGR